MNTDELEALVSGLIGAFDITDLRHGDDRWNLTDDEYVLLVRWLSGERLDAAAPAKPVFGTFVQTSPGVAHNAVPIVLEHEDDEDRPPQEIDFEGVTLLG